LKLIARQLNVEDDGIPGYIVYPERAERGPSLLIIHQHSGLTGHLKTEAYKFAKLGYVTVIPNLYHLLGYPALTHIHTGTEIQKNTSDSDFVRVIDQGWRYLLGREDVDSSRVGICGYCMGGRIGIHFAACTPNARAFVAYYPSVRDELATKLRPRHPYEAARKIKCPSLILFGGQDSTTPVPVQERLWASFLANGQPLEWHFFPHARHGFASPEAAGYDPQLTELVWPLVVDFLDREIRKPSR